MTYYPDENGYSDFVLTAEGIQADIDIQMAIANNTALDTLTRDRAYNQVESVAVRPGPQ